MDSTVKIKDLLGGLPELRCPEKLRDLYSGFRRPREVNPEAFDNRIKFWEQVITKVVDNGLVGRSCFCTPDSVALEDALKYENLRPAGLSCVLVPDYTRDINMECVEAHDIGMQGQTFK